MGGLQAKSMASQRNRAEPSQDGGYALLWQRYDNNKMVAMRYYGNVMIFYIFNSTVIDWTCFFASSNVVLYDFTELMLHKSNFTGPVYVYYVKGKTFPK